MEKYAIQHQIVSTIFSTIPVRTLVRMAGTSPLIGYYHMISDEEKLHLKYLYRHKNIAQFKRDLDFLASNFSPIGMADLLSFFKTGTPLPERCLVLTFDDGFREAHDIIAPILLEKGISATYFINSAFVDNKHLCHHHKASLLAHSYQIAKSLSLKKQISEFLAKKQVYCEDVRNAFLSISYQKKELLDEIAPLLSVDFNAYLSEQKPYLTSKDIRSLIEQGFSVGGHSVDHPLYATLSVEDQITQTIESVKFVRERFHLNYGVFAFPQSDRNVSNNFFSRINQSRLIDLSFGTAGLLDDSVPNNLQRFSLENPLVPARNIVTYQHARKLQKLAAGRATIQRQ